MANRRFTTRLLGQFIALSLTIGVLITGAVLVATGGSVRDEIGERMTVGGNVLENLLEGRQSLLANSASVLTSDFGFKQAVATGDRATIESALFNQRQRIGADLMLQLSLQGEVLAGGEGLGSLEGARELTSLAQMALGSGRVTGFALLDGSLYQLILLPVRAPNPIGLTVVGFEVDSELAEQLKSLTNLDIAFVTHAKRDRVVAATLDKAALAKAPEGEQELALRIPFRDHQDYIKSTVQFPLLSGGQFDVQLAASLDEAFEQFDRLVVQFVLIAVVAVLLSLALAVFSSRSLSRPLAALVDGARRIASGDYRQQIDNQSNIKEVRQLGSAINQMQVDIAQREDKILYQARHDHLTGLLLSSEVLGALRETLGADPAESLTLVSVGLNQLSEINDAFGQEVSEVCLMEVARRLRPFMRAETDACRLRSDFKLLIHTAADDETGQLAELREALEAPYEVGDVSLRMTVSLGLARYPQHADTADDLWRRSSIALSTARADGERQAEYSEGEETLRLHRVQLLSDLRQQLQEGVGDQLHMVYQPKQRLSDQPIDHAEALIRWIHPEMGFVSPEEFIPLAEQSGLINELTHWVLDQVAGQVRDWQRQGLKVSVAINLSAEDLFSVDIRQQLSTVLERYELSAGALSFELTESAVIRHQDRSVDTIEDLRQSGFAIAVDDFGTGYSSLSQLKSMPVSHLKIDKCFVLHLATSLEDQVIVRSTVELAHALGLEVIAEGVEDAESLALLREYQCDWIQGYYLSKPMKAGDFVSWLGQHNTAGENGK